ncbi:MAG: transporter substrate-binding domain-containing protein [Synergistales bacterium]|nr:transporter substrate-binding domain-containing protein [Synergistales bacterium]
MKKTLFVLFAGALALTLLAGSAFAAQSTIDKVLEEKKIVIGTAPGYLPFEMKDGEGNFMGYDVDLGRAIAEDLGVEVEFKQFEFSGLIPALQVGEIDLLIAGMTIRGDRALAVSFPDPYYATGQVVMVPAGDSTTESWEDLDKPGKRIALSQGTTGALLAKEIFDEAQILDFPTFPEAAAALVQGAADGIIYDEPGVRMYEAMHPESVRGIYDLISCENLGIGVRHNDFATIQWLNSFQQNYLGSPEELASRAKWFESTEWMEKMEQK